MKVSTIFSGVALLSFSSHVTASALVPRAAKAGANALAKRAEIDDAYSIVSTLYTNILPYTGSINNTAATVTNDSSQADIDGAFASVGEQLTAITSLVQGATAEVSALTPDVPLPGKKLAARQAGATPDSLALLIEQVILEISGALNNIIADLGLVPLLAFLSPLVASLSGLLLSLTVVVNNLLALVQALVDGLLIGLSIGLAGIVL